MNIFAVLLAAIMATPSPHPHSMMHNSAMHGAMHSHMKSMTHSNAMHSKMHSMKSRTHMMASPTPKP